MISLITINITDPSSYNDLKDDKCKSISYLIDDVVIERLKKYLGTRCDRLEIEFPYYDSDYLSTYYIHYSQKLCNYPKACCRIHVFNMEEYCGYITLRPTVNGSKIGKTYLSPAIIAKENAYLCLSKFVAHIMGNRMEIESFPWKSQETDISVCAHTATWTIIRYFGNKFRNYINATIGDVVEHTRNEWGRKTPSLGLTPIQVSDILKDYNFTPLILEHTKTSNSFLDNVFAYIESGLPLIGFLDPRKHAISVMGHGELDYNLLDDDNFIKENIDEETKTISHSRLIKDLYVMDDNTFPYQRMPIGLPTIQSDLPYNFAEIKYIVVPLYKRMQLTYDDIYARFASWKKTNIMNWISNGVHRIYIASSNSLKRKAMESKDMNPILKEVILTLPLPKFVWCIDLSSFQEFKDGKMSGRIIIDTTAATMEEEPWILRHDQQSIQFKDLINDTPSNQHMYNEILEAISPYSIYENNLKLINGGETYDFS